MKSLSNLASSKKRANPNSRVADKLATLNYDRYHRSCPAFFLMVYFGRAKGVSGQRKGQKSTSANNSFYELTFARCRLEYRPGRRTDAGIQ